jgi:hypothetical protein
MRDTPALIRLPLAWRGPFADARAAVTAVTPARLADIDATVLVEDQRFGFLLPFPLFLPGINNARQLQGAEPKSRARNAAQHVAA